MKTILLALLLTGAPLLAQTPPPIATDGSTNADFVLRRALRRTTETTNATPVVPAAQPAVPVAAPQQPLQPNVDATAVTPAAEAGPDSSIPAADAAVPTPSAPVTPEAAQVPSPALQAPVAQQSAPKQAPEEEMIPPGQIDFIAADLDQVLKLYALWVNRTILRAPGLASPPIVLKTQTPLTKSEAVQALDAVLALGGIAMINIGEKFVKAVPLAQAEQEGQQPSSLAAQDLPDMGQYVTHVIQLKTAKPSELVPVLQAFSKTKGVLPIDSSGILVIRDFTENVKRMLELIEQIDIATPSEFVSEVIPIKYALAGDIANALSSVSGTGSGGTSVGTSRGITGPAGRTATVNRSATVQPGALGQGGAAGAAGTSTFSDRLRSIINRASTPGGGDIEVLGTTKIIADERTNSLLVFATRQDMQTIKDIVAKLDVVLAQVLIESIIMEVSLDDSQTVGFSYIQRPQSSGNLTGVGAIRNTTSFLNPGNIANAISNATSLSSGLSYYARWSDDLDVTVQAIAANNRVNVLSRPRIQTSHAVPAQLFIGNTVPYITGTSYGNFTGGTSQSQYQEKRVGITLDVLPLINPDGLVVMDIQQVIQQLGTPTTIDGNSVPTTTERSASAKVAVKDRETIILGGFIANQKSTTRSGVPFLRDIPLLGALFRSSGDSNQKVELIILMRPTVLPTPSDASAAADQERARLPALRQAEHDERSQREKQIKAINKKFGPPTSGGTNSSN